MCVPVCVCSYFKKPQNKFSSVVIDFWKGSFLKKEKVFLTKGESIDDGLRQKKLVTKTHQNFWPEKQGSKFTNIFIQIFSKISVTVWALDFCTFINRPSYFAVYLRSDMSLEEILSLLPASHKVNLQYSTSIKDGKIWSHAGNEPRPSTSRMFSLNY